MEQSELRKLITEKQPIPNLLIFTGEEKEVQKQYLELIDKEYKQVDTIEQLPKLMQFKSLFQTNTTYVTKDPKAIKLTKEQVESLTQKNRLIILTDKVDKRSALYKTFRQHVVEFHKLTIDKLVPYIRKRIEVDSQSAIAIAVYCNLNITQIELEIDKLKRLEQEVTIDLIKQVITPPLEDAIFEMIDGIMQKDIQTAIGILTDMLELKESPIKIISILYTKVRQVFMIQAMQHQSDKVIAEKTGIGNYQVRMNRELLNYMSLEELAAHLKVIQKYEVYMKTGQVDPEVGIEYIIARMVA